MFFQVKYVYDWLNPAFASVVIIAGRVKASAKKIVSGNSPRTSVISHSQNGTDFVCGLSTRNARTPWRHQCRTTSRSASQSPRQSSESKLTL